MQRRFWRRAFAIKTALSLNCALVLAAVSRAGDTVDTPASNVALAPLPARAAAPAENPASAAKRRLGRQLFFDPRLSGDNSMSCATCHIPDRGFGDGKARGRGSNGVLLERNTQGLWNVAFYQAFFWDGRSPSLEAQALEPIRSPLEMNQDLEQLERELNGVPRYREQFRAVFGTPATARTIADALAAFQRSLWSGHSPFDRHLAGEKEALSPSARRGLELFVGAAGCVRCHHGPMLTDGKFHRIGVSFRDTGRARVTGQAEDRYRFRTPTLRNVALTAPYMHDGSLKSLEDVVEFYYRGVPNQGPGGLKIDVNSLAGQSFSEVYDLAEFLRALTGETPAVKAPKLP